MDPLPQDALPLIALAFVLGAKHGLDADHLVAIDGLTRFNAAERPGLARWCGVLFSLGHGAVVVGIALVVGLAAERWIVPAWLEAAGAWLSIAVLAALGVLNLAAVLGTPAETVVRPVGLRAGWFSRLMRTSSPPAIMLVGVLFAISFDTISQAALFAMSTSQVSSALVGVGAAAAFMVGMIAADGLNGVWVASLLQKADRRARIASRVMGLAVAALSLGVAALGAARLLRADLDARLEGSELSIGLAVIAAVAASFVLALALSRPASRKAVSQPSA